MRLFGYFDETQGFNAVEFAAKNYKGFLAAVAPDVNPTIVFSTAEDDEDDEIDSTTGDRLLPFTGIYETPVKIVTPSGEEHALPWALCIDLKRGEEIDAAFLEADNDECLNILWQMYGCIFRDIRTTLYIHHRVKDLLSLDTLEDIQLYSPHVANLVSFCLEKDVVIAPHHIDASLVGRISSLRWLHEIIENDGGTFPDTEIHRLLMLTKRSFTQNPHHWIGFLSEHETTM